MIFMILAVWALDVCFLPWHWTTFFQETAGWGKKSLFFLSLILFVLSLLHLVSADIFSAGLFILLGAYLFSRVKMERRSFQHAYDEDRGMLKEFLLLCLIGLLLKWFWGVMALSVMIHIIDALFPIGDLELAGASLLSVAAGIWMIFLVMRFRKGIPLFSLRDLLGLSKPRGSGFTARVLPFLTGTLIAFGSAVFLMSRPDQPVTPFSEMLDWTEMSWAFGLFFGAAIIAGPFLEEVIFRGFFFKMLQEWKGARLAFWVVGSTFGFLHMEQYWGDWAGIAIIFFIGFVLTGFRVLSGSARPGMIMHYTFNILMVVIPTVFFVASHPAFTEYYAFQEKLSFEKREALLIDSIAEDNANAMAYDEMAWLYLDHGDPGKALASADQALKRMPQRTIFQHTRAEALFDLGRAQEAALAMEEIYKQMPKNKGVARRLNEMKQER